MILDEFDAFVNSMVAANVSREKAILFAEARFGRSAPAISTPSDSDLADADEDAHVDEGDTLMRSLGFEVVSFSQKKRAKVTPGIPDRKYHHRRRRLTLWWEAKQETGRQRPAQREFQMMAEECGEIYVLGKLEALKTWLVDSGVATREGETFEPTPISQPGAA